MNGPREGGTQCVGGVLRPPDFYIVEGVVLPIEEIAAVGGHGVVDRYGNTYLGIQGGVGAGPQNAREVNVYAGWMMTPTAPTESQLRGFISGPALTFDVTGPQPFSTEDVVGLGVGFAGNDNGNSVLVGVGTPGVNLQGALSIQVADIGNGNCQW